MENQRLSYLDYCKALILDNLENYKGLNFYDVYELSNSLTEGINADGSATYSTYEAKQYIKDWFDDLADFVEYHQSIYGEPVKYNPFEDSEKFHCLAVILGVENIMSQVEGIHEDFILDDEIISTIIDELENRITSFNW